MLAVRYSPLCDTDSKLYTSYLSVVRHCHGEFVEQSCKFAGGAGGARRDSGNVDIGSSLDCAVSVSVAEAEYAKVDGECGVVVFSCEHGAIGGGTAGEGSDSAGVAGLASSVVSKGGGKLYRHCVDVTEAEGLSDTKVGCGTMVSSVSEVGRGPHYERNKRNREEQKMRKLKRKLMNQDWRKFETSVVNDVVQVGVEEPKVSVKTEVQSGVREKIVAVSEGVKPGVVGRGPNWERNQRWRKEKQRKKDARSVSRLETMTRVQGAERVISERSGYFSRCPQDVQEELRRTRAEYLIAKNQRDTLEERRKLKEMNSSVQLIADTLKLMKMSEQVTKRSVASKIGGWAETLVSGASESFVASAASQSDSVPSLESVRESESVSRVGESVAEARRAAYQSALEAVELEYESYESFNDVDYEADILAVKKKFSDVAYTAEEAVRRGSMIELATRLCSMGFSMEKINEALVELKVIENDFCY